MNSAGRARTVVLLLLAMFVVLATLVVSPNETPLFAQGAKGKAKAAVPAQAPPVDSQRRERPITVDVNLVLVNVSVADPMNRLVMGLEKENFRIFEGDKEQRIRTLSMEDVPVSIALVFDCSGSMSDKSHMAYMATMEFLRAANTEDEFLLVDFSDQPRLLADFTRNVDEIASKLLFVKPKGSTAMLDALYLALNKLRHAKYPRRALLMISDGGDNHSRYSLSEVKELVKESDVQVYGIGIYGSPREREEVEGPWLMRTLAGLTGGRAFAVGQISALDVARKIGLELRNEYILGYRPENDARDGTWRKITVKLNPPRGLPPLRVYNKRGYYAPQ